jgi:hypothetical protein
MYCTINEVILPNDAVAFIVAKAFIYPGDIAKNVPSGGTPYCSDVRLSFQ